MQKNNYTILLYYKYVHIDNPLELMARQRELCMRLGLKGRIIVATEGINGTVEGLTENTEKYIEAMNSDKRFADIHWKKSAGTPDGNAFPKLSIKVRKEIVSAHLDENDLETGDVNPNETTGTHLKPEELHEWFRRKAAGELEFYIVDMRNDYEFAVGHFVDSIRPSMQNFRDLASFIKEIEHLKDKKVLSVCTGGVRCEKASGYLIRKGFTDVYQLDGGIVSYIEKYPGQNYVGSLYVFDGRTCMSFDDPAEHVTVGRCGICSLPTERYTNCANPKCHLHFLCCENCSPKPDQALCASCLSQVKLNNIKENKYDWDIGE